MNSKNPREVLQYARKMKNLLGEFNGGFIGKYYPKPEAVRHSAENLNATCRAFIECGKYLFPLPVYP